jgi:4-amino-4-deoxy-L-arabinose transferase-like glycosyltransferase
MVVSRRASRRLLAVVVVLYVLVGSLYAWETPKWQVPDEPAHFNYIEHLAVHDSLPVLEVGDYPHEYLEEIKAAGFPPEMSIDSIRYESWQPPLYYALAAALVRRTECLGADLQFLSLRLFSVLLGAAVLVVIFEIASEVFPDEPFLALAAAAFAATLPMHVAMTAGIGNDTLAELVLSLILYQAVMIARRGLDTQRVATTGMLLGLALLTKTTIYSGIAVIAAAAWSWGVHRDRNREARIRSSLRGLVCMLALATLFGGPWFLRNTQVYGPLDFLAWRRHGLVVAGQLRTVDLLVSIGPASLLSRFAGTTFRSFWGQFGWMGVLLDQRIYQALGVWSALLAVGCVVSAVQARRWHIAAPDEDSHVERAPQRSALRVLAFAGLLIALLYLGYNVTFVQHQGRYLFPALAPLSLAAALGVRELVQPQVARVIAVALLLIVPPLLVYAIVNSDLPTLTLMMIVAGAGLFAGAGWLPDRWRGLPPLCLYAAFVTLDLISLYRFVLPAI